MHRARTRLIATVTVALLAGCSEAPTTLPLPAPGEVAADFLDGRPVFVVHDINGVTAVLDAMDPHSVPEYDFYPVLAWCKPTRTFEDLWFGSVFDASGSYLGGGPSPTGMAAYEILDTNADRVIVGNRMPSPPRPENSPPVDRGCAQRSANYLVQFEPGTVAIDPMLLDDLVVHEPPSDAPADWWFPTTARILGQERVVPTDWPTE